MARELSLAVGVQRVVHRELPAHVFEIVRAGTPEAIRNRLQTNPFGRPVLSWGIRRSNDPREFHERRIIIQPVALNYRIEGTVFPVVPERSSRNVENRSVSDSRPIGVLGKKANSASGSTNRLISHGQAIRSTFAFSRVTHLIKLAPGSL